MLRKRLQGVDPIIAATIALVAAAVVALTLVLAASAEAGGGGISMDGGGEPTGKPGKAKLLSNGKAIPPSDAPKRVVKVIEAANEIRKKPYKWGGGHSKWNDRGYDCSGAVSYALHGGRMLKSPLDSSGLMRWGRKGKGDWVTVYAHGGHTYAMIAGLRWDTSGGKGPRWHKDGRSKSGYKVRHYKSY